MHNFNTKTPQITVCCKTSYDIVFSPPPPPILLSVQNSVSWFSGNSSKLLLKDVRFYMYRLSPSASILYRQQTRHAVLRRHISTNLYPDTWCLSGILVSGVNAAWDSRPVSVHRHSRRPFLSFRVRFLWRRSKCRFTACKEHREIQYTNS